VTAGRESAERNRLLALIPQQDREDLLVHLVPTMLPLGRVLYRSSVDALYFPLDCVVSILAGLDDGISVEAATVGNEGLAGAFAILHPERMIGKYIVQVAGDALRLEMADFSHLLNRSVEFQRLMHRYLFALTYQIIQAAACNTLHTTEERCARWLLMTQDRAGSETFTLTQEFLASMLGMRRATVNLALGVLKNAGLIRYVRGQITVMDRPALESASCPCYSAIRDEYSRLSLQ
jgi:CRP-like cAMP-binding protein